MGYFVDFVPYKYQTKSKLSHKYLKSTKLCEIDISKISVSNMKYHSVCQKPISPSSIPVPRVRTHYTIFNPTSEDNTIR